MLGRREGLHKDQARKENTGGAEHLSFNYLLLLGPSCAYQVRQQGLKRNESTLSDFASLRSPSRVVQNREMQVRFFSLKIGISLFFF